jgi:Ca2+-binding EF-hand superfamily protein
MQIPPRALLKMITVSCRADPRWNEIKKFFQSADANGDGCLSKEEFKNGVMASCGVSDAEADSIVAWV